MSEVPASAMSEPSAVTSVAPSRGRRRRVPVGLAALALLIVTGSQAASAASSPAASISPTSTSAEDRHGAKPTVVLVHGAFADSSSWNKVVAKLQRAGYPVIAAANPLRDLSGDSAYVSSIVSTIPGPVVLVGHSYGGEVISNAAIGHSNVQAMVFVAGFAPEQGESGLDLTGRYPGSLLPESLLTRAFPLAGGGTGTDAYIDARKFHTAFAADLPARDTALMAATQRPASLAALGEPSGPPAWKTLPSWYLVAGADKAIPAAAQRFMATRAKSHTVEVKGASHVVMLSHPDVTTDLIVTAARSTSR
ncbi:alpha/beta hydrolase [Streptomyces sp. ME02-8801-2C]|uniref:alpha/beta fold hydrolase n=1 Tax=Streptomyces sp. ME02-8801-2C TaxID=3028680 RepID=UPI0029A6D261|nr:alpha/beta hydrolase [Streptomyces sp. ME02-8801-2C]MDX3458334.1 alpha/beta hydrolase [Streptomyces sp. ME02-8801-2C]